MAGIIDLAADVAEALGIPKTHGRDVVDAVLASIEERVANKEVVTLRGFGTFKTKTTKARTGRNPQTGAEIQIESKEKVTFKSLM